MVPVRPTQARASPGRDGASEQAYKKRRAFSRRRSSRYPYAACRSQATEDVSELRTPSSEGTSLPTATAQFRIKHVAERVTHQRPRKHE